jgi:site-specific recombinase XerD
MAEVNLRQLAAYLIATDRSCRAARDVRASHVAGWCAVMAEHALTARTINYKLNVLRRFFEHPRGSAHPDAPAQIPVARRPRPPRPARSRPPARTRHGKARPLRRTRVAEPKPPSRALPTETTWEEIALRAPHMVATMTAYLEQITVSHRPASVVAYALALRHLAAHVTATDPGCVRVAAINRSHIEQFKLAFAARPGLKGAVSTTTIRHNLGMIRTFFERIIDWDWHDAPRRVPIFAGDIPKSRRAAAEVLGRPDRGEVHGHPGRSPRSAPPAVGRTVGPHG